MACFVWLSGQVVQPHRAVFCQLMSSLISGSFGTPNDFNHRHKVALLCSTWRYVLLGSTWR